jgi:hypothetical protein
MASIPRTHRRLCLAVAGAAVLTALTLATAGASPPTPLGGQAPAMTRLGASPSQDPGAGSPPPRVRAGERTVHPVAIPRGQEQLAPDGINPVGINDRGQIVGMYSDTGTVLEDPGVPLRGFL